LTEQRLPAPKLNLKEKLMINPHGGKLINRLLEEGEKEKTLSSLDRLPSLTLDPDLISDVENMATGVYSPLEGF